MSTPTVTRSVTEDSAPVGSSDTGEDHVWRFALGPPDGPAGQEEPLLEMVRSFLQDLLTMGFLTRAGERVRVDGFAFTNAPTEIHPIFPDEVAAGEHGAGESPETKRGG